MSDVCDLLSQAEAGGRGVDRKLHGTYCVVAHFHYLRRGALPLCALARNHLRHLRPLGLLPKITGLQLKQRKPIFPATAFMP
jgi:heme/copper-type cytochrome/quinol oxidase subunit 1